MGIFAVYDTVGIQNYVFASSKLSENVGASRLVADIFNKMLPEVLENVCNKENCITDWKKQTTLSNDNEDMMAEIIYQGGGNAFVAFYGEQANDTFQLVTKKLLVKVLRGTCGVGISVAAKETIFGNTYIEDYKILMERLLLAKGNGNIPVIAGNQSVTRQSVLTGMPVVNQFANHGDVEWLDQSQIIKRKYRDKNREADKTEKTSRASEIDENEEDKEIRNFEDLTLTGDSFIGIIHADGNNMGNRIAALMGEESMNSYEKAVPEIRKLSAKIASAYKNALEKTRERYKRWFGAKYQKKDEETDQKKPMTLPYIQLIADGDDLTVLTSGRHAISFATVLLKNIQDEESPFGENSPLSACAGVVIFHHHFPFAEAYKLAEECCGNAKKKAREMGQSQGKDFSFLDFHLHQSGNVLDLDTIRKRQYKVDEESILARPWRVDKDVDEEDEQHENENCENCFNTDWFETMQINWIAKEDDREDIRTMKWPRSKQKALRDAIGSGGNAVDLVLKQVESRNKKLPKELYYVDKNSEEQTKALIDEWKTYMFDILEVADVYEKIGEVEV